MTTHVEIHSFGRWNDEVGSRFEKKAEIAASDFNTAANKFIKAIEIVDSYSVNDVNYDSQKNKIHEMRIEYRG